MLESIVIVCDPISLYTHLASLGVFSHTPQGASHDNRKDPYPNFRR